MSYYDLNGFPPKATDNTVYYYVLNSLRVFRIHNFGFARLKNAAQARIYIPDHRDVERFNQNLFINAANQQPSALGPVIPMENRGRVRHIRVLAFTSEISTNDVDNLLNASLKYEPGTEAARLRTSVKQFEFPTVGLEIGYLTYLQYQSRFNIASYFSSRSSGQITLGRSGFRWLIEYEADGDATAGQYRLDIAYSSIHVGIVDEENDAVVFTLFQAPKVYHFRTTVGAGGPGKFGISMFNRPGFERVSKLGGAGSHVVGKCLTYYIPLGSMMAVSELASMLKDLGVPFVSERSVLLTRQPTSLKEELDEFRDAMKTVFPMGIKFQLQKLATNGYWRPSVIRDMLPSIHALFLNHDPTLIEDCLCGLYTETPFLYETDRSSFMFSADELVDHVENMLLESDKPRFLPRKHAHLATTYHVRVTPTSIYLEGPYAEPSNRVLRLYEAHAASFVRVTISDENGEPLFHSLSPPLMSRFRNIMTDGLDIYGEGRYQFFGFSNSSLRTQSSWFCAPFKRDGETVTPEILYRELGQFENIRCVALCASRIGQAFSDTACAFRVESESVTRIKDEERGGYCFSDGCGLISKELLQEVWGRLFRKNDVQPTTLQIRFGGCKGIVSLDPRLPGRQLVVRKSMWKFDSTHMNLEVCGSNHRPIPAFLNHQIIKILEDLGVPSKAFLDLQTIAVKRLMATFTTLSSPRKSLGQNYSPFLKSILAMCADKGWAYWEDRTVRQVIQLLCLLDLRNIKYRGRIAVDKAVTLYGVMDESGLLAEGEICVIVETSKGKRCVVRDQVVITRAPTMAPGDVQVVKAVAIPRASTLARLTNCIVFSKHGARDLPSKLSGGDLDGDLYSVFWDKRIIPQRSLDPANYTKKPSPELNRPVRRNDIVDFYLSFMWTDKLGEISTKHKILADQLERGTRDKRCVDLAEMASDAVDAAKFGHIVNTAAITSDMREMCKYRPDFMQAAPMFNIDQSTALSKSLERGATKHTMSNAPDFDAPKHRYYESKKTLGRLYRSVDELQFIRELEHTMDGKASNGLPAKVWSWVESRTRQLHFRPYLEHARQLRSQFEEDIIGLCHQFSMNPPEPLSELEVISGSILGISSNSASRRIRDMADQLRRNLAYVIYRYETWIRYNSQKEADRTDQADFEAHPDGYPAGDGDSDEEDADGGVNLDWADPELQYVDGPGGSRPTARRKRGMDRQQLAKSVPFAIACLYVAIHEKGQEYSGIGRIESFWLFAATTCVAMVDSYLGSQRELADAPLFAQAVPNAGMRKMAPDTNHSGIRSQAVGAAGGKENQRDGLATRPTTTRRTFPTFVPAIPLGLDLTNRPGRPSGGTDEKSVTSIPKSDLESTYNRIDTVASALAQMMQQLNLKARPPLREETEEELMHRRGL